MLATRIHSDFVSLTIVSGNTSDFSGSIQEGFFAALDEFCLASYGRKLSEKERKMIYRYCEVHFKRNLRRVSNISAAVPPEKKDYFRSQVLDLLDIPDYDLFHNRIIELVNEFVKLASWFKWYLNYAVVVHLFKACRKLSVEDEKRFQKLKKDTNAEEGLGYCLQMLHARRKDGLQYIMETIFKHVEMSDQNTKLGFCGIRVQYPRATPQQKKRGREPKSKYKGPESAKALLRATKRAKKSKTEECRNVSLDNFLAKQFNTS